MSPEQETATLEALRLSGDYHTDIAVIDKEHKASLTALLAAALGCGCAPLDIAAEALCQLSKELMVLSEAIASDISPEIFQAMISGMAHRARVAAEVSRRIDQANPKGTPSPVPMKSEAAE